MNKPTNDDLHGEQQDERRDHLLSRRRFIASLGAAGVAIAASGTLFPKAAEASSIDVFHVSDYPSVEAAVAAANAAGGGTVYIPPGTYWISSTMHISSPIYIVGAGNGNDTSNTNGSGFGVTTLRWSGSSGATMFYFKSATTSHYLFGGGIERLAIRGDNALGTAIRGSSVGLMRFATIEVRDVLQQGILLDADNGVLTQFNTIEDYSYVYGATPPVENANGIVLRGNTSAGVTQNHIISVKGLVHNGSMLRIEWSDNNVVEKLFGVASGSGTTLYLANGVGGHATYNYIQYMVGKVHAESNTSGNRIAHLISEGSNLSADPGAQLHYEVEDYVRAALYTTHKFAMSDTLSLSAGSLTLMGGGAAHGISALQWPCIAMPDGVFSKAGVVIPSVNTWDNGTITTLTVRFSTDSASTAGKSFRLRVRASSYGAGSGIATPEKDVSALIAAPVSSYSYHSYDIPLALSYQMNDGVFISLEREGAHSGDTASVEWKLLGVDIHYVSAGPYSPGSGTYAVTKPYI
ncbi:hypothetical protein M6D81_26630 [Paenibacillus sp. J5C_2022]|uniref:glycosyl hydrolase family 28-related protein n=1 Tax=Paenibacillus sp. J5C2022 TaxID=2977129 RepID=UPI0021D1A764|nr:glycosyl hydrolase family 28-related protein [Paenibacillus sp. J5C2022]MCU6712282.1 hypothetical protein [Paenibacillus sp. J5C2022]